MQSSLFSTPCLLFALLLSACVGSSSDVSCEQDCSGRECGLDPVCGQTCGNCGDYTTCNDGQCDCDHLACGEFCCAAGEICLENACVACDPCEGDTSCAAQHRECVNDQGTVICGTCLGGFHEDGSNCVVDEQCLLGTCAGHGDCVDSSGVPVCSCYQGYAGDFCNACDTSNGWHWNVSGDACTNDPCDPNPCTEDHKTQCNDNGSGVALCSCNAGYQDYGDDACRPVDPCAGDTPCVSLHRECANDQGTAICGDCIEGFHEEGDACLVDVECLPSTCSGHGDCSDSSGLPVCNCYEGYADEFCDACDTSNDWQWNASGDSCIVRWWDANWQYRRALTIDSAYAVNDYQILLNISYVAGMKVDFSDMRFVNEQNIQVLDYWIEEQVDGNWCSVWVEFDDIVEASAIQAWLYYGNVAATSLSNGEDTFILWDDFEDGSLDTVKWADVSDTGASVVEQNGYATLQFGNGNRGYLRSFEEMPLNVEIMFDAKRDSDQAQTYFYLRWDGTHTGQFDTVTGTYAQVSDSYAGSQSLHAVVNGVGVNIGSSTSIPSGYDFNSYKINRHNGNYEYWLNNVRGVVG